ncbi:MAG: hypothetical protein Sapg2KO_45260 [Saprospiraceae bacterium]
MLFLVPFLAKAQEGSASDTLTQPLSDTSIVIETKTSETLETELPVEKKETPVLPVSTTKSTPWIPLILSLLSLAGVVYLFFTKMNKSQLGPQADFFRKDFEQNTQELHQKIKALETQQADLENRLKAVEDLKAEQASEEEVPETLSKEATSAVPVQAVAKKIQTMYSVAPKNGIFFLRQLSETFKAREHIYRIEVLDETRAYYYLVDDSATRQHAFNIPDSYILPAMELEGTGRLAEATQVDVQRGSLVKAGQNWQIEEKAVLNYSI